MKKILTTLILILAFPALSTAATNPQSGVVDLQSGADLVIDGASANQQSGYSSKVIGDVNGDGLKDIAVGARFNSPGGKSEAGSVYIVFGSKNSTGNVDLANLGNGGFRIDGANAGDNFGTQVANAGDINGDGRSDILISAPSANGGNGAVYVIYGDSSNGTVSASSLAGAGIRIDGQNGDQLGMTGIDGGYDINGDGRSDVVLGAPGASPNGKNQAGSVYVITNLNGNSSTSEAFARINGNQTGDRFGTSVAFVNGGSGPMVLAGASGADRGGKTDVGEASLVSVAPGTRDASTGKTYAGASAGDRFGWSVAYGGSYNGDGKPSYVVGAPGRNSNTGAAYVFFSNQGADAATLTSNGVRFDGTAPADQAGYSVASADINGDGKSDVLVGAHGSETHGRTDNGSAYVIYGGSSSLNLGTVGNNGFRVDGPSNYCQFGAAVSGGDVNGDGNDDFVGSGEFCSPRNRSYAGITIVIWGWKVPPTTCEQRGDCPVPPTTCQQRGDCPVPPTCQQLGNCPVPPTCQQLGNCPIPPIVPPTKPKSPIVVKVAKAKISGRGGCVKTTFAARITGQNIKQVKWVIDGRTYRTVKTADKKKKGAKSSVYSVKINPSRYKYGVHKVSAQVTYVSGATKNKQTLRFAFQHCKKKTVRPKTTG